MRIIAQEASWRRNHFAGVNSAIYYRLQAERRGRRAERQGQRLPRRRGRWCERRGCQAAAAATEGAQVTALVAIKDAALAEAVARLYPTPAPARHDRQGRGRVSRQGRRDGERLAIHNRKSVEG
jgi:hypothetical protein